MLTFDIETNGLLDVLTKIHCIVIYDTDTSTYSRYRNNDSENTIDEAIKRLEDADVILAHNGIGFDYPAIRKLYPEWKPKGKLLDSIVITRLIWTNLKEMDFTARAKGRWKILGKENPFPEKFGGGFGSHSLKNWGIRLGEHKGDFVPSAYLDEEGNPYTWETIPWSEDMEDYCEQDVRVTAELVRLIESKDYSQMAIDLEHQFATIINRQERYGFKFDVPKAKALEHKLQVRKAELEDTLQQTFPPWERIIDPNFIPKVNNKTRGYVKGVPFVKKKTIVFNPSSRDHIADRLQAIYGWKPSEFTQEGKPKVDETVLKALPYEPCKYLAEYLLIIKRLGMVSEGNQAWLKVERNGRIHGRVNTNGAVTGRCTHSHPNVAQVPAVRAPYGSECRELFTVDSGYRLVGADASGLELRCLAHYMARYDNGAYGKVILEGDIHTENQKAAGLPTRDNAKTFIYGFLYGAGVAKIGEIVGGDAAIGGRLRKKFLKNLPALEKLITAVQGAASKGYLKGIDGRHLHIRSEHAALNTLLQSAGALIMKKALVELDESLQEIGMIPGDDYEFVANIHDEFQIQVKDALADTVAKKAEEAMTASGEFFNFRCLVEGEAKIGDNWKETH